MKKNDSLVVCVPFPPWTMQALRRALPLSMFFLLLLFLACSSFLCLSREPIITLPTPSTTIRETPPTSQIVAPREDIHQRLNFFTDWSNGSSPTYPSSAVSKLVLQRKSRSLLATLHSNARSRQFSARAEEFFHGSSSKSRFFMTWISSQESFGRRELLAIESLFKSHANARLLILSNALDSSAGRRLLQPFLDNGYKVAALCPDYPFLFKNTPAELWFARLRKGGVNPGEVSLGQNLSNLLRLAVLYKFGGVYLDTDVVLLRSLAGVRNAIGAQTVDARTGNWTRLNNAVMVFDRKHPLLYKFIQEFALTFNGNKWGHNGPYLVSRVVERVTGRPGFEFAVLPPEAFYPVDWSRIGALFRGPRGVEQAKWVSAKLRRIQERSFAVHLWNRQSGEMEVEEGSVVGRIVADRCVFCDSSMFSSLS